MPFQKKFAKDAAHKFFDLLRRYPVRIQTDRQASMFGSIRLQYVSITHKMCCLDDQLLPEAIASSEIVRIPLSWFLEVRPTTLPNVLFDQIDAILSSVNPTLDVTEGVEGVTQAFTNLSSIDRLRRVRIHCSIRFEHYHSYFCNSAFLRFMLTEEDIKTLQTYLA